MKEKEENIITFKKYGKDYYNFIYQVINEIENKAAILMTFVGILITILTFLSANVQINNPILKCPFYFSYFFSIIFFFISLILSLLTIKIKKYNFITEPKLMYEKYKQDIKELNDQIRKQYFKYSSDLLKKSNKKIKLLKYSFKFIRYGLFFLFVQLVSFLINKLISLPV